MSHLLARLGLLGIVRQSLLSMLIGMNAQKRSLIFEIRTNTPSSRRMFYVWILFCLNLTVYIG
ncbi:hypothetical protein D3C71_1427830 [compost metagenome]